jgi:hypothetical protein
LQEATRSCKKLQEVARSYKKLQEAEELQEVTERNLYEVAAWYYLVCLRENV